jgi:hypothetical protein
MTNLKDLDTLVRLNSLVIRGMLTCAAVAVDDLDAACQRVEDQGVNWKKRLTDGRMKNVAFILDPDNYCKFFGSTHSLSHVSHY